MTKDDSFAVILMLFLLFIHSCNISDKVGVTNEKLDILIEEVRKK